MKKIFRLLRSDEIEVKVKQITDKNSCLVLLYKDARCDQRILDECVGQFYWQRRHYECNNNLFCEISIYDPETKQWVCKSDAGSASDFEKEKGHASDSFKRAAFNWGIGRELYTAPKNTWIKLSDQEYLNKKEKKLNYDVKFFVHEIKYDENDYITKLVIVDNKNNERYLYENGRSSSKTPDEKIPKYAIPAKGLTDAQIEHIATNLVQNGWSAKAGIARLEAVFNSKINEMPQSNYKKILDFIAEQAEKKKEA